MASEAACPSRTADADRAQVHRIWCTSRELFWDNSASKHQYVESGQRLAAAVALAQSVHNKALDFAEPTT